MEKELQFQFYQGECASSMRYEDGRKKYSFAMDDMMPFAKAKHGRPFRCSSQTDDVFLPVERQIVMVQ